MGEEAKNAKRDIPRAVLLSLVIQGAFCYLFEYFGANFFLNSGYTMTTASASPAPIGDMMQIVGTWVFGTARPVGGSCLSRPYCVSGPDRHDSGLHEHRRSCHFCHGP